MSSSGLLALVAIVLDLVAIGLLATWLLPRRQGPRPAPGSSTEAGPPASDAVVGGLVRAFDLAGSSPALQDQLSVVLHNAGVSLVPATPGSPLDPSSHYVVGVKDGGQPATIADLVRPGWAAGSKLIRPAEVIAWKG